MAELLDSPGVCVNDSFIVAGYTNPAHSNRQNEIWFLERRWRMRGVLSLLSLTLEPLCQCSCAFTAVLQKDSFDTVPAQLQPQVQHLVTTCILNDQEPNTPNWGLIKKTQPLPYPYCFFIHVYFRQILISPMIIELILSWTQRRCEV